jgi:hypothetical protein
MKTILTMIIALSLSLSAYSQNAQKVAIYRWNINKDWVEARQEEGETLAGYGYKNKTFVCYLFREPQEGTVAINRWNLASTGDWVSVPESASADMERFGYTSKILLGYAYPSPKANTVAINRWYLDRDKDWVTVPESASPNMQRFGYINKTLVAYTPR